MIKNYIDIKKNKNDKNTKKLQYTLKKHKTKSIKKNRIKILIQTITVMQ